MIVLSALVKPFYDWNRETLNFPSVPGAQLGKRGMVKRAPSVTSASQLLGASQQFWHPGEFMNLRSVGEMLM